MTESMLERIEALKHSLDIPNRLIDMLPEISEALAQRDRLMAAVEAFLDKWKLVEPAIDSAFTMEWIHGREYKGPHLGEELKMLRAAAGEAKG